MKKLFLLMLAVLLTLSLVLPSAALASNQDTAGTVTAAVYETEEPEAVGLTPDSPFYFLKLLIERIELLLTFSSEAKAEKLNQFAERRLAELNALPEEKQERYAERLVNAFAKAVAKAEGYKGKDRLKQVFNAVYNNEETVDESVYSHPSQLALRKAWEKAPEQAKPALERAMQMSQTGKIRSQTVREAVYAPGPNTGNGQLNPPPGLAKKLDVDIIEITTEEADQETDDPVKPGKPNRTKPEPKKNR
ncbi:MAG: hypothetical protein KGZ63_02615 [Clostridiales bacterium]|jgi:hypothetical protein|nr:hypothetical protein [Clostridiales bacterium]